jgi:hypothetical protein
MINNITNYKTTLTNASNNNISSENIDGYNVSYLNATSISDIIKSKKYEFEDIMNNYLIGVVVNGEHIMYLGVR